MLSARCVRGMHLDMNSKHTGFELYRTFAPNETAPELSRKLDRDVEWQGPIEGGRGYTSRAKLAVKTMTPLRFPRYLDRDPRDFFFLTQKPVLPGPALTLGSATLAFSSAGLPHSGWPHAFARARFEASDGVPGGAWLLRIDPSRAVPQPLAPESLTRPLAYVAHAPASPKGVTDLPGAIALYVRHVGGLRRFAIGEPPADAIVLLRGHALDSPAPSSRVLAIAAKASWSTPSPTGRELWLFSSCLRRLPPGDGLAGRPSLCSSPNRPSQRQRRERFGAATGAFPLALVAETRPRRCDVPEVEPKPYRFWGWLQGQRVRYFPQGAPRFKAPEEALAPGAAAGAGAPGAQATPPGVTQPTAPTADGAARKVKL